MRKTIIQDIKIIHVRRKSIILWTTLRIIFRTHNAIPNTDDAATITEIINSIYIAWAKRKNAMPVIVNIIQFNIETDFPSR